MPDTALAAELALNGEGGADDASSSDSDLSTAFSIADASKAFRTGKPTETPAASTPPAAQQTPDSDRPRNPDGTFAKVNADGTPQTEPAADAGTQGDSDDTPADDDPATDTAKSTEPKLLKLAGEAQRGEPDIELDVSDLPPEVIKRLALNEERGMRRKEYDQAVDRMHKSEQDRIAFETQLKLNPVGVVMEKMAPDQQVQVAAGVLLQNWDQMAPLIQTFWNDAEARMKALTEIREGSRTMSTQVSQQIQREQAIQSVGRVVDAMIPDSIDPITADEYRSAAWTRLNTLHANGAFVTLENIPTHLTSLAARYGFQDGAGSTPAEAPKRPKLAVHTPAQSNGTSPANGTPPTGGSTPPIVASMSPQQFQDKVRQKNGARAVAPQGAGGGSPITRTQIPQTATIEQASAALRGTSRK